MRLLVDLEQVPGVDMCVALGRGEAGVAEQLLDGPKVGPPGQEVGGEDVAQGVGAAAPRGGGLLTRRATRARTLRSVNRPPLLLRNRASVLASVARARATRPAAPPGLAPERHDALLAALAEDPDMREPKSTSPTSSATSRRSGSRWRRGAPGSPGRGAPRRRRPARRRKPATYALLEVGRNQALVASGERAAPARGLRASTPSRREEAEERPQAGELSARGGRLAHALAGGERARNARMRRWSASCGRGTRPSPLHRNSVS